MYAQADYCNLGIYPPFTLPFNGLRKDDFMKKILILTCNTGQGHNSTAGSVAERFKSMGIECVNADALSFVSPKMSDFISSWHVRIYRYAPVLFNQGYEYAEKHNVFSEDSAAYKFFCLGVDKLKKYIVDNGFDSVICVHVFPALMITELLKKSDIKLKTGFIATDYTCSPGVADSNLDAYFIPHINLTGEFVACGVDENKIIASGIPVKDAFLSSVSKKEARNQLGIDENYRHMLMMCGSMGCGPMEAMTEKLKTLLPQDSMLTVVCGTNEKLKKKIDRFACENIQVLGFTDKVSLLMDSADLYVTKAGGLSTTEAARKRLPMAFIDAVSGCESYNRYFFLTRGMAIASNDPERLPEICVKRLYDEEKLRLQRDTMQREFSTDSLSVICSFFTENN